MKLIWKTNDGIEYPEPFVKLVNYCGIVISSHTPPSDVDQFLQEGWLLANFEQAEQTITTGNYPPAGLILQCLHNLDYYQEILPPLNVKFDGVIFLGADYDAVCHRLMWLLSQMQTEDSHLYNLGDTFYLFGGPRQLDKSKEGPAKLLAPPHQLREDWLDVLMPDFNENTGVLTINLPTFEAEMMDTIFRTWQLPPEWKFQTFYALEAGTSEKDLGNKIRPYLEVMKSGHYLILSGQPWCEYHKCCVLRTYNEMLSAGILKERFSFEVCGPSIGNCHSLNKFRDAIARQFHEELMLL